MKVKLTKIFLILILMFSALSACAKPADIPEKNIVSTYVGSYSKYNDAMGVFSGAQMLVLYDDGTATIYNTMVGANKASGEYSGSYNYSENDTNENQLYIKYTTGVDKEGKIVERETTVIVKDGRFRAQLYLINNMPDDGNSQDEPGLNFYEIKNFKMAESEYYYMGTYDVKGSESAYILLLNKGEFVAYINNAGENAIINGTYQETMGDVMQGTPDMIEFTYDVKTTDGNDVEGGKEHKLESEFNDTNSFVVSFKLNSIADNGIELRIVRFLFD